MQSKGRNIAPWGSFALASCLLIWLLCQHWSYMMHPVPGTSPYGVLGTFWASGWAVRHHLNPYVEYPLTLTFHAFGEAGQQVVDLNLNPPSTLPLFSLWSRIPPLWGCLAWAATSTSLFMGVTALLICRYRPERKQVWWLLTCGATVVTLNLQQIYVVLLLLSVGAWFCLESEQDMAAGVLLGLLAAIKPNFVLWPLFLALSGRLKPLIPACVTATALSITPVFLYGPAVYSEWLKAAGKDAHFLFPEDLSLAGNFTRLGNRPAGLAIAAMLMILLVWLISTTRPSAYETTGIALCAAILCSPLGWLYYTLLLAPILFARRWTPPIAIAALILWINPGFVDRHPYPGHWSAFVRGLIYFTPLCMLLIEFCRPALKTLTLNSRLAAHLAVLETATENQAA